MLRNTKFSIDVPKNIFFYRTCKAQIFGIQFTAAKVYGEHFAGDVSLLIMFVSILFHSLIPFIVYHLAFNGVLLDIVDIIHLEMTFEIDKL